MKKINIKVILLCISILFISCIHTNIKHKNCTNTDSITIIIDSNNSLYIEEDTLKNDTTLVFGAAMYNVYEKEFTKQQFDSICKADIISNDLTKWYNLNVKDGETQEIINEYLFIKSLGNYECIYRLVKTDDIYKVTKRIKRK